MARPLWNGTISFGLLNVPVSLVSAEKRSEIDLHLLDARDRAPIRYRRVNSETGEEVEWKDIVKAYEYEKGQYVTIEKEDIASAAPTSHETVELLAFVERESIGAEYFEKPYVLVPGKKAGKGYVLLRDTLQSTGKIGIAKVVIRTREYLAAVTPKDDALWLLLMRYPKELVDVSELDLPTKDDKSIQPSAAEKKMAAELLDSMTTDWDPDAYEDEFQARLTKVIDERMKSDGAAPKRAARATEKPATNVVDFMDLLKKSLSQKGAAPAKKAPAKTRRPSVKKAASPGRAKKAAGAR